MLKKQIEVQSSNQKIVSYKLRKKIKKVISYCILIGVSIIFLFPFYWQIATSLMDIPSVYSIPLNLFPPKIHWENYVKLFDLMPFFQSFINTSFVTFFAVFGQVLSSAFIAYGITRIDWKGKHILFVLVLGTMMIPWQVSVIPRFILFKNLGWIDKFLPLIVPFYFGFPFSIFVMRQHLLTIPREMDEAAEIDGCSKFGIWARIILPQSKPALMAITVFAFRRHWNDFLNPLVFINSNSKYTLALMLRFFVGGSGEGGVDQFINLMMAGSFLSVLPCLVVFFFAQKYFMRGINISGVKG